MEIFKVIANALFPNRCIACGEIINKEEFLCDYCYEMKEYVDYSKICLRCGLPKKECQCKNKVFHFNGCVAPFYNKSVTKDAMYRYKFARVKSGSKFFANEMAKTVKTVYNDIVFDGISYVPMHKLKQLKRGFNQSEELAYRLSKILGLKVYSDLLHCKFTRIRQHDLPFKLRFQNVKNKYKTRYKVYGKTILLVDDIKTSGASLDECARQLLLAGADNVYCITGVITELRKENKNGN